MKKSFVLLTLPVAIAVASLLAWQADASTPVSPIPRNLCINSIYIASAEYAIPERDGHNPTRASLRIGIPSGGQITGVTSGYWLRDAGINDIVLEWSDPPLVITYTLSVEPTDTLNTTTWTGFTAWYDDNIVWGVLTVEDWQALYCSWLPLIIN
jgi:hypothetical protein